MPRATWTKRGLLLDVPGPAPVVRTHAALPSIGPGPDEDDGRSWLYYSGRDERGRAHISRCPLRVSNDTLTVDGPSELVLAPGELGAFDDAGVTHSCVVERDGRVFLYYSGWSLGRSVPFTFHVGLAVSDDRGRTFRRASRAPILERTDEEPFMSASPAVLVDGERWRMWYVSCVGWSDEPGGPRHRYLIRSATSADGIAWYRDGSIAVGFESGEYSLGRPCVVRVAEGYRMWFCARGDHYRLAVARSRDGVNWERDEVPTTLEPSGAGWDSEMACYPWEFRYGDRHFLLYNGNGYGLSGIGYAVRIDAEAPSPPSPPSGMR